MGAQSAPWGEAEFPRLPQALQRLLGRDPGVRKLPEAGELTTPHLWRHKSPSLMDGAPWETGAAHCTPFSNEFFMGKSTVVGGQGMSGGIPKERVGHRAVQASKFSSCPPSFSLFSLPL